MSLNIPDYVRIKLEPRTKDHSAGGNGNQGTEQGNTSMGRQDGKNEGSCRGDGKNIHGIIICTT
jgi:hypothetical protein